MSEQDRPTSSSSTPADASMRRVRLASSTRREKPQLSCNLCRRRKLKCNRQHPCDTCSKRGLDLSCTYPASSPQPSNAQHRTSRPSANVQDRIQQLESLVVSLMQKTPAPKDSMQETKSTLGSPSRTFDGLYVATPTETSPDDTSSPSEYGSVKFRNSSASYMDSSHWASVLDGIAELKDYFEVEEEKQIARPVSDPLNSDSAGPQLLYGCPQYETKEEIIASLPARPVVDRMVSRYFNSFDMSPAVLHSVQFLKEYDQFWKNPSATPPIWLALLFTILCLGAQFQKFKLDPGVQLPLASSTEPDLQTMMESYRQKTVQCLVLGKYTNGGPYVMEALILYFASEHFLRKDAEIGVWILLGTIVQLAMHMGYHRDPKHFTGMSPLAGEMRRRVWATVNELDFGISAQMGLPNLIKQHQADTELPRNLLDRDFDEDTKELPRERPDTELTPMLYRIAKTRMISTLGSISDFIADTRATSYNEVMKIDARLEEVHAALPDCLKWRSIAHCITDPPHIIMQKLFLCLIFYKAKIVLHCRYLTHSGSTSEFRYSRDTCLDAAIKVLEYQQMLEEETQPYCQLYQERWRLSSLVNNDFLLATSILCSYLQQHQGDFNDVTGPARLEDIQNCLRKSQNIWIRLSSSSREAEKAAGALNIVLRSHNVVNPALDIGEDLPMDFQQSASQDDLGNYFQEYLSGFSFPYPYYDPTIPDNWALPINEPIGSNLGSMSFANPGFQTMNGEQTNGVRYGDERLPAIMQVLTVIMQLILGKVPAERENFARWSILQNSYTKVLIMEFVPTHLTKIPKNGLRTHQFEVPQPFNEPPPNHQS